MAMATTKSSGSNDDDIDDPIFEPMDEVNNQVGQP